jgi:hypothetical protein
MTFKNHISWNKGKPWPEEIKRKISESHKGKPKPWNSYPRSEATRIKLGNSRKGIPSKLRGTHLSEEHRMKISEALKGHIPWNKGKTGIYSKETLKQMSEASKGITYGAANKGRISPFKDKHHSAETIIKMHESANGRWSKKSERKKQSIAKLGSISGMKGKHHTEESKRKMSERNEVRNMAIKRRMKDGTIKLVTFTEDKDVKIRRLEALLKEVTQTLADVMGYNDKPIAAASTYDCYK